MNQKKMGAFIKTLRKEKNLTQEQLAETLGVSTCIRNRKAYYRN